jgi:hypothetical protein
VTHKKAALWQPFYVMDLPPAELGSRERNNGDDQHNKGRFFHSSPRRGITADKKPR